MALQIVNPKQHVVVSQTSSLQPLRQTARRFKEKSHLLADVICMQDEQEGGRIHRLSSHRCQSLNKNSKTKRRRPTLCSRPSVLCVTSVNDV